MFRARGIHHEVLLALAEEIRQTLVWLSQEDEAPDLDSVRFRLRTLREAATVAGLPSVESVLAESEDLLGSNNLNNLGPAPLEEVLGQLSSLIVELAKPAEQTELNWVASLGQVEQGIVNLSHRIDDGRRRLANLKTPHSDASSLILDRALRDQATEMRTWRKALQTMAADLRLASRELLREISLVHQVPVAPTMIRLRERIRRWGREHGKPVTLQYSCGKLEVGTRQFAALSQVLESLLLQSQEQGAETPETRRSHGKSTVANLRVEAKEENHLLVFLIENDGQTSSAGPKLTTETIQALSDLRARLWHLDGNRLLLKMPVWLGSFEALPVATGLGLLWIPLFAVERILGPDDQVEAESIVLDRREASEPFDSQGAALLCRLGPWRGVLHAKPQGQANRIVPRPAEAGDPTWVLGRTAEEEPIFHPLAFVDGPKEHTSIFP